METAKSRVRFGAVNKQSNTGTADTPFCAFLEEDLSRAGAAWTIRRSSNCEDLSYGTKRWLVNRVLSAASYSRITTTLTSTFSSQQDQQYQTITFQPPYQDYSLEELRVTDYDQGRRIGNTVVEGGLFGKNIGSDNDLCSENDPVSDNHPESESNDDSEQNDDSELDNDSKPKTSSHNRARKNAIRALDSRPLSGDRLVDLPTLERIIRGLKLSTQRQMRKIAVPLRNPDGTYSVPLEVVLRHLNRHLEREDRVS
jgi:hypothetical protein